jgi:hypothetical protein
MCLSYFLQSCERCRDRWLKSRGPLGDSPYRTAATHEGEGGPAAVTLAEPLVTLAATRPTQGLPCRPWLALPTCRFSAYVFRAGLNGLLEVD